MRNKFKFVRKQLVYLLIDKNQHKKISDVDWIPGIHFILALWCTHQQCVYIMTCKNHLFVQAEVGELIQSKSEELQLLSEERDEYATYVKNIEAGIDDYRSILEPYGYKHRQPKESTPLYPLLTLFVHENFYIDILYILIKYYI